MSLATASLPTDPAELRAFAGALQVEMQREIAAQNAEIHTKTLYIEKLKMQLAALRRVRFGRSSEKLDRAVEQLELVIGGIEEDEAETETQPEAAPSTSGREGKRARGGRRPLPNPKRWCTSRLAPARTAVGRPSARSARTSARCWNTCPPTSSGWRTSGRS
jgi:hypothetical protein